MTVTAVGTYDINVGEKLDVEDLIYLLSPYDCPFQGMYGSDGRTALSTDTCDEVKVEWLEDSLQTTRGSLGANAATTDTYITVSSGEQPNFINGALIKVDSEYMVVTGNGTTTDTLTVTRGYNSTAASHTSPAVIVGAGMVLPEGSDAGDFTAVDRVDNYNYTMILGPYPVQISGTENRVAKYGLPGTEFDYQVSKQVKKAALDMEQAIPYGTRYQDSSNKRRSMGGITYYVTTNVDSTTTSLTEAALLAQLQACFDAGGMPDRFAVGSKQARVVAGINEGQIRYGQAELARGQRVEYYDSPYGRQEIVLNRWLRTSDAFIYRRDDFTISTLRPLVFEMLAKTGDSIKGQVVGEKTGKFREQIHQAAFSALT